MYFKLSKGWVRRLGLANTDQSSCHRFMPIVGRAGKPIASDVASWANAAPEIEAAIDPNSDRDASHHGKRSLVRRCMNLGDVAAWELQDRGLAVADHEGFDQHSCACALSLADR